MQMESLISHVRYATRQYRQSPVFTATAVLTLALGIGGTTAIFSLMHGIMLRSLPVADPASLYRIGEGTECCMEGGPQDKWGMYSYPLFERFQQNLPEFDEVAAFQAGPNDMSVRRDVEQVSAARNTEYVTGNYFRTFGIRPFAGRLLSPEDDQPSATPVAVLSYRTWQMQYGADTSVLGSTFVIEGHPFTVIGITPPGFYGETLRANPPDLWIPLQQEPLINGPGTLLHQPITAWLRVIGRAKPGANLQPVGPRLTTMLRQWLKTDAGYPANWASAIEQSLPNQTIRIVSAGSGVAVMKEDYGRSLQILLAVCGLVLLIACANVANLLLARAAARRSQTAVRLAIGASRRQVISQALAESISLSLLGGVAGLVVAIGATRLLIHIAFRNATMMPVSIVPSLPVLAFAIGLSLFTGVLFGTAPAWFATRTQPIEALRGAGRSTGGQGSLTRKALLIAQATLSVVLVAGAMMLARSLGNLEHQDLGYERENRIVVAMNPPPLNYAPERLNALYRQLEIRLRQMPGIENVGLALYNPLTDNWGELIMVQGRENSEFSENGSASWNRVSASYLQALGQKVVRGRGFSESDNENSEEVVVVNETFAKRYYPNEDPLDKHFGLDLPKYSGKFRIVGVINDSKFTNPRREARAMFFASLPQWAKYDEEIMQKLDRRTHYISGILLVTHTPTGVLEPQLRKAIAEVDSNLTVNNVRSLSDQIALTFDQERAVASLAGLFGIVALLLAAVGLYGVTAYTVAQKTKEIGVRMALGADRERIVRFVLTGAFRNVAFGLLLGILLAIGAGRLMSSQLYGVKSWDIPALGAAAVALGVCAFFATVIPAFRAAAIEPMKVLRAE
jgi:predicted permease